MTKGAWMAALLALIVASPCAAKGVIRGHLIFPGGVASGGETSAGYASSRGRQLEAVVYLEAVPAKIEKQLAKKARKTRHVIVQQRMTFIPRVTTVAVGDSVRIENRDNVYHNAFSVSPARRFDLGKYPPGHITTMAFDDPGVINLHCDIHPKMMAFVVVLGNHAYVMPDSTGRFELPKIPDGDYTLKVWHPRLGARSKSVKMPRKGNLEVDLKF